MTNRHRSRALPLLIVVLLVMSACGQAAVPTATPSGNVPVATATTAAPGAVTAAAPVTAYSITDDIFKSSPYPKDKLKQLLADNFYLAGMQYGKGEDPQYGGTAIFTHRMDIPSSDPMVTSTISLTGLTKQITGTGNLVRPMQQNNFEPEGFIAKSWQPSSDFKEWTFKLRPDIKWHDGDALTAEDMKFWFDLQCFPPKGRKLGSGCVNFGPLKEVQAVDTLTLKLVLKEPAPSLLETLMANTTTLSHKRNIAQAQIDKGNLTVNMSDLGWVAVGPFKIDRYDAGSRFKTVRNPLYFEKDDKGRQMPYLDGIDNPIISDPQTGVSAFRAGRTDRTAAGSGYHVNPAQVSTIKKDLPGKTYFTRSFYSGWGILLNSVKAPFTDIKLRKALQLYIDRDEWSELAYGGFATAGGMMAPGSYWVNPEQMTWQGYNPVTKQQDREEAKRLVKEGGYTGLAFEILCRDNYLFNAEAADSQFRNLGLKSTIDIVDTNRNTERGQTGQFQAELGSLGYALPGRVLTTWVSTYPFFNKTGDPKFDEFNARMLQADLSMDPAKRRDVVWDIERYLLKDKYYIIPGPWEESTVAVRTHIKGMWVSGDTPLQNNSHQTIWMDQKVRDRK